MRPKHIATASYPGEIWDIGGRKIGGVHSSADCYRGAGTPCVIHNPSRGSIFNLEDWPYNWRDDTQVMERLCSHGIGHPDTDQYAFWNLHSLDSKKVHGCDGCCISQGPPVPENVSWPPLVYCKCFHDPEYHPDIFISDFCPIHNDGDLL